MIYKVQHERAGTITIKTRQIKNFHKASFLRDLQEKVWSDVETLNDPNDMWSMWKDMLMQAIKTKQAGNKKSPWITDHLRHEMHRRDFLKKKAVLCGSPLAWDQYKRARNHTNNEIKNAKRKYFTVNLESSKSNPKKTWQLINDLSSRHPNKVRNIVEQTITEPSEIVEELNLHFSSVGKKLASEIPSSNVEPESYLEATKTTFSLKDPSVNVIRKLLTKLKERKAVGLDNIPSRLLKMAGNIIVPSLT